jgi:ferric-dicitrate binding protein FerR (iron transport regulator)
LTQSSEIRKQALAWLAWVDAEHECAEQQKQFEAWLCADERHREVYSSLEQSWRRLDGLRRFGRPDGTFNHGSVIEYGRESVRTRIWRNLWQRLYRNR